MLQQIKHEQVVINTAVPTDKIKSNIFDAGKYCLSPIDKLLGQRQDGAIALIGGGPSLARELGKVQNYSYVIICGSAHDYFVDNFMFGNPNQKIYCLVCDADPIMCSYLSHKKSFINYLIASQCDSSMFLHIKDMPNKYLWHAAGGEEFNKTSFGEGEKLIIGGCTIGTRAIGMAMAMGFKKIHLFGFDSCLTNTYKHHAYEFNDPDKESLGDIKEITIGGENSPVFKVAHYMLAQIFDFQYILNNYADKLQIEIFGDGALAYIMQIAKQEAAKQGIRDTKGD